MWTAKDFSPEVRKSIGEKLKARIRVLDDLFDKAKVEALVFARELSAIDITVGMRVGTFWDCPKSPFGLCVYDHYEDGAHDNCLFCHGPEERK